MSELNTGTRPSNYRLATRATLEKIAEDFREENKKLNDELEDARERLGKQEAEIKKAFWAGFEIAYCTTDLNIQARWIEYEKLRGLG